MKGKNLKAPKSEVIAELPAACVTEEAACAFLERRLWGDCPCCRECGSTDVYSMKTRDGKRNPKFLWRCRDCGVLFNVRTNTIMSESLLPLRVWVRAFWEIASAKNGCSALELSRKLEISYKSALFLAHRIKFAQGDHPENPPKLEGIAEADEIYVGARRPRHKGTAANPINKRGRGTKKVPVLAVLQRGGDVRTRVVACVNAANIRDFLLQNVDPSARLMTDKEGSYRTVGPMFSSYETVDHGRREYARGDVTSNAAEGFFARVRRGLTGVHHSVSPEHLGKYMDSFAFMHNTRRMDDGERTVALMRRTHGNRLMYKMPETQAG